MIEVRLMDKEGREAMNSWYKEWGFGPLIEDLTPPTTYVAYFNGEPMATAALVLTNTPKVAFIENIVGNPAMPALRRESMPELLRYIEKQAEMWGIRYLFMGTLNEKVKARYEEYGFKKKTDGMSYYFKELGG